MMTPDIILDGNARLVVLIWVEPPQPVLARHSLKPFGYLGRWPHHPAKNLAQVSLAEPERLRKFGL